MRRPPRDGALGRTQRRTLVLMGGVVLALHAVGFYLLIIDVAPRHYGLGGAGVFAVGTGITAYTLGLRHAFDADHISAIDNTTRKLMSEGKRPVSVGFWFSLGHSTVVFGLAFLLAAGVRSLVGPVSHPGSELHAVTTVIGTAVSGVFLLAIGLLNVATLRSVLSAFRALQVDADQSLPPNPGGVMNRLLGRFARSVREPRQMYPVGVLFGLGFDTATEVALLVIAAGAAGSGLPFRAIVCLPILFAAGMSLLDTIDGACMTLVYGWAYSKPVPTAFYNIVVTMLSVVVAIGVGSIELGGLAASEMRVRGEFWTWLERININTLGLAIVALFALTWIAALSVWHFGGVEARFTTGRLEPSEARPQQSLTM